jgi:hypothetical protein
MEVFNIGTINVLLSDEEGVFDAIANSGGSIVLNLTGDSHFGIMPDILSKHSMFQFEEIVLKWPDGGFPCMTAEFWTELIKYVGDSGYTNLIIHCRAGHGRTGTAAACLLMAGHKFTPAEAVEKLRADYCEDVVETSIQVNYLGWVAEKLGIENDSQEIIPSYHTKHNSLGAIQNHISAASPPEKTEDNPVNFDWDSWI